MSKSLFISSLLLLAACDAGLRPYYEGGVAPSITELSDSGEPGNLGGGELSIRGSGFGTDPAGVIVVFGAANAELLSVDDSEIRVLVPTGPIAGGEVTLTVATAGGQAVSSYRYDLNAYAEGEPTAYKQLGFVQVNNFWESCLGGLSDRLDSLYPGVGCTDIAYLGWSGTDGTAEAYNFSYPGLQSQWYGFFGGVDMGTDEWRIERPALSAYPAGLDDLQQDLGSVYLTNSFFENNDICLDMGPVTPYYLGNRPRYGNGEKDPGMPEVVDCKSDEAEEPGVVRYRGDRLEFCAPPNDLGLPTYSYKADWAIPENFFRSEEEPGPREDVLDDVTPSEVELVVTGAGISGVPLKLPESLIVAGAEGFGSPLTSGDLAPELWGVSTLGGCLDDDDRAGEGLDDVGLSFTWPPSEVKYTDVADCSDGCVPGDVVAVETFVRISLSQLPLGWFGPNGLATRAVITVPDEFNTEREDGVELSRVDVPGWVLYQMPTTTIPSGTATGGASPTAVNKGYFLITIERVTNYSVYGALADGTEGVVVMSYVTGDFGFYDWTNPLELNCE